MDGTKREIARPSKGQRAAYSGHKKIHCLSYHGLVLPDGIVGHFFGPLEGRRSDQGLFNDSGLLHLLDKYCRHEGRRYPIYGDAGYWDTGLLVSTETGNLDVHSEIFRAQMSTCRTSIEWFWNGTVILFPNNF